MKRIIIVLALAAMVIGLGSCDLFEALFGSDFVEGDWRLVAINYSAGGGMMVDDSTRDYIHAEKDGAWSLDAAPMSMFGNMSGTWMVTEKDVRWDFHIDNANNNSFIGKNIPVYARTMAGDEIAFKYDTAMFEFGTSYGSEYVFARQ